MRDRPTPQFTKSLPSEKKISLAEAERAIYIDFEGFEKDAPALLGVLIDGAFEQIILDEKFQGAASYQNPMRFVPGKQLISELLDRSIKEDRRIVAFSAHEKEQCMRWYQIDISKQYVNARIVARMLSKGIEREEKPRTLKEYEQLTGFVRKKDTGQRLNTKCLREALKDLERYGALLNKGRRTGWTKLREHNRQDVEAMKHIVMATFNPSISTN